MARADYSKIAAKYDQSPFRGDNPVDPELAEMVARRGRARVLDVACGTGSWLAVQVRELGRAVHAAGADLSDAMLAQARAKLPAVPLVQARAEELPFEAGAFDYVTVRFALHHFEGKLTALDELLRVLARRGTLAITNIVPEAMHLWWLFRAFPEARAADAKRFWSVVHLEGELKRRGLDVKMRIRHRCINRPVSFFVEEARRRDASELALLDDEIYRRRMGALEREAARDPAAKWYSTMTFMRLVALKSPPPARAAARSPRAAPPRRRGRGPARG